MRAWIVGAVVVLVAGCGEAQERDERLDEEARQAIETSREASRAANESLDQAIEALAPTDE